MQTISDIMTKDVEVLNPNADLVQVAQLMRKQDVGVLPVSDGGKLHGIVTKSDVVCRALAKDKDPRSTRANEVMTRDVDFCFEDQSVEEAADTMHRKKVGHLLVLDRERNLVGVVSLDDLPIMTPARPLRARIEEAFIRPTSVTVRPLNTRRFRMNTGAGIGLLSATLVTLGFFAFRRRMGMSELFTESRTLGEREIKAA